jgi:hypothetical protein
MKIITTRYGWCCYYEFCVVVLVATCVCGLRARLFAASNSNHAPHFVTLPHSHYHQDRALLLFCTPIRIKVSLCTRGEQVEWLITINNEWMALPHTHTHTQIMRHRIKQPVKQPHASLNLKVYRWDIGHYQEAALALGHHAVLTRARKLGRPYRQ